MKEIITAIGNQELNNILKNMEGICIKNRDIQYQEGIIEALDKYKNIDILILNDEIIGELKLEDLISEITMLNENIEIILITKENFHFEESKCIVKVVNNKENYVKEILKYLLDRDYIKTKKVTNEGENYNVDAIKSKFIQSKEKISILPNVRKKRYKKEIDVKSKKSIVVIGNAGVRKNNFYFYIV